MRLVKSGTERIVSHFTCCYATTCTISVCWTKIGENKRKKCKDQIECPVFFFYFMCCVFLPSATKLGQGNIFRSVSRILSTGGRGAWHVWHTVNERAVCIIMECILVVKIILDEKSISLEFIHTCFLLGVNLSLSKPVIVSCELNSHWRQFHFLLKPFKTPHCQFCREMSNLCYLWKPQLNS